MDGDSMNYSDNEQGVREFLQNETELPQTYVDNADYLPDHFMEGVWMVTLPNRSQVVVYLNEGEFEELMEDDPWDDDDED
jgi:hypothetical protein